jgi:hypothetical protein
MRSPRFMLLGALALIVVVVAVGGIVFLGGHLGAATQRPAPEPAPSTGPSYRADGCNQAAQRPFSLSSIKGINYGGPATVSGGFAGPTWLRSGTGSEDHWADTQPALEADLTFLQQRNLGPVLRVFVALDQTMRWDKDQGFQGFYEPTLQNFQQALNMFDAHGMKVILVLYDQEIQSSPGNFHFQALDGRHQAMRDNYLKATDQFLRRFGSSPTVAGWDLFNEAYNSLGREGGLAPPPGDDPVSPNYPDATVHAWIHDLYQVAKCAAPDANFTVSDTTELYWHDNPDLSKYQDSVDFYDVHVYDDHPKLPNWKAELQKPFMIGEMGGAVDSGHYRDQKINPQVIRFWLEQARSGGLSATLAHSAENNLYPADRRSLTPSGQVIADFQG